MPLLYALHQRRRRRGRPDHGEDDAGGDHRRVERDGGPRHPPPPDLEVERAGEDDRDGHADERPGEAEHVLEVRHGERQRQDEQQRRRADAAADERARARRHGRRQVALELDGEGRELERVLGDRREHGRPERDPGDGEPRRHAERDLGADARAEHARADERQRRVQRGDHGEARDGHPGERRGVLHGGVDVGEHDVPRVAEHVQPGHRRDPLQPQPRDVPPEADAAERRRADDGAEDEQRHDDAGEGQEGDGRQVPEPQAGERHQHGGDGEQLRGGEAHPRQVEVGGGAGEDEREVVAEGDGVGDEREEDLEVDEGGGDHAPLAAERALADVLVRLGGRVVVKALADEVRRVRAHHAEADEEEHGRPPAVLQRVRSRQLPKSCKIL